MDSIVFKADKIRQCLSPLLFFITIILFVYLFYNPIIVLDYLHMSISSNTVNVIKIACVLMAIYALVLLIYVLRWVIKCDKVLVLDKEGIWNNSFCLNMVDRIQWRDIVSTQPIKVKLVGKKYLTKSVRNLYLLGVFVKE